MAILTLRTLLTLLPFFIRSSQAQASGTGTTTRYWDCCKASCSWPGKAQLAAGSNPVGSCDANDSLLANYNTASGCNGGSAYMCGDQTPWAVSETLSYGYAAVNIAGGTEASWCCACYELTFTSGPVAGKQMIVQATNTGGDLGDNHFDLAIPGGGFGIFDGCIPEYGTPTTGWGAQYGGIASRSQCDAFPLPLRAGCYWRFDWFQTADNPAVSFRQVACPAALTAKTGCVRADDGIAEGPTGPSVVATWSSGGGGGVVVAPMSTSKVVSVSVVKPSSSSSSVAVVVVKSSSLVKVASSSTVAKPSSTKAAAASSPVSPPTSTKAAPAVPASSTSPSSSTAPPSPTSTTSAASGPAVPKWGQCGGLTYYSSTSCVSGTTCVFSNPWYSQCL